MHSSRIWIHPLGICKIPNIHMMISPLKKRAVSYREHALPLLNHRDQKELIFNKTGNARINVTLRRLCVTTVAVEKAISVTHSECVFVALVIRHVMRMRLITLSSVTCLVLPYFSTYLINGRIFGKKCVKHKIRALILYTNSVRKIVPFQEQLSEILS